MELGSNNPGKVFVGIININSIKEIALLKINESNTDNIDSIIKSIIGTAKSIGLKVNFD
nr:hypothetical protein [Candidatus Nardonella dryophthoridicola]